MNILEKIEVCMQEQGIKNRRQLSELSGIPYTTISGFYAKGYDKMKLSTVRALARCLGVSMDYLIRDEVTDPRYGLAPQNNTDLTPDEHQLVTDYREFNAEGKEKVRDYVADLKDNPKYKKRDEPAMDKQA